MSCTEQTVFLMTLCLSRFSNKQHSLWLIRKEWPPHRPYTDPRRLAHQPISPFISPECLLCFVCPVSRVPEANLRGRTDVKLQWKCVYRLSGDETNTPLWKHTHGQTHRNKCERCKVVYNERLFWSCDFQNGCACLRCHIWFPAHLLSIQIILESAPQT